MRGRLAFTELLLVTMVGVFAAPALRADEVVLKDGRTHVGKTRRVGDVVEIRTLDGVVRVHHSKVDWDRTRDEKQLRADFRKMAARRIASSARHLELARVAHRWGLYDEMWQRLGFALQTPRGRGATHGRIRGFMAELEPVVLPRRFRKLKPEVKMAKLLRQLRSRTDLARIATIAELLANLPQIDARLRTTARKADNPLHRAAAARAISFRPAPRSLPLSNEQFLYRTAIIDGSAAVRELAMRFTAERHKSGEAIEYMSPWLKHANRTVRVRTAEAFGVLGDPSALPHLAIAHPVPKTPAKKRRGGTLGGSTRAHMSVGEQRTFIRDFDVEIAQAAAVANPQVGVVRSGVVFDVTVIGSKSYPVEIVHAQRNAIRRIAGVDPGPDAREWPAWVKRRAAERSGR